MGKKVSDQTNGLALFWTYFYIRICLEPNDLAMSYTETANHQLLCLPIIYLVIYTSPCLDMAKLFVSTQILM